MWFDEEDLAGKPPGQGDIFLRLLAASLEIFELRSHVIGKVSGEPRIANERIDIRSHKVWDGHAIAPHCAGETDAPEKIGRCACAKRRHGS